MCRPFPGSMLKAALRQCFPAGARDALPADNEASMRPLFPAALVPLLTISALLAACDRAERSLAPYAGQPQVSVSATGPLNGSIEFHSTRDIHGDFDASVMNAE